MNKDQVQGRANEAKGNLKEAAGKLVGNQKLQGEGLVDQVKGKTQAGYGDVKEQVKKSVDRIWRDRAAAFQETSSWASISSVGCWACRSSYW